MPNKQTLITQNLEEVLTEEDLTKLIESGTPLKHYIGFEISGKLHIGSGIMSALKIKDLQEAGVECNILLADWHTWINDKLGGDMDFIQEVAVNYFKEAIRASLKCVGADPDGVKFILGSDLYHNQDKYWQSMVDISKNLTLSRVVKSSTIMGRKEGDNQVFARLLYPPMQVADIFFQGVNIAHAGLDQRKAHVISREVARKLSVKPLLDANGEKVKPIAIHHHLVLGLGKPSVWPIEDKSQMRELWSSMKMSKSNPDSCVFVHDSTGVIERKIKKAFCPEKEVQFNPILDWTKYIVMPILGKIQIVRKDEHGGDVEYSKIENIEKDFANGDLHPMDLKQAVAKAVSDILAPAREHFSDPKLIEVVARLDEKIECTV